MGAKFNETWDYLGYKSKYPNNLFDIQKDWNYTLVTRINKISARFHSIDLKGGADTITIRENLLPLFTQMEYVHLDGDIYKLSGRYTIKIDNNIEENTIIIGQDNYPNKIGKIKVINYG